MPALSRISLYFRSLVNPQTPRSVKIFSLMALLYGVSPFDFVPDFIPFLGQIDDIVLITFLIIAAYQRIPRTVKEEETVGMKQPIIDV